tara:strand:- start:6315 stop:6881 length:567 start_codon:yes stop_codon:yes gene_type:complete
MKVKKKQKIKNILEKVSDELEDVFEKVNEKQTQELVKSILKTKKIFLIGSGRSGLVAEAFVMRLNQLGVRSYLIEKSKIRKITKKDFLIVISGSGKTKITEQIVKNLKKSGAKICLITSNKKSPIARKSNLVVEIKAKTKLRKRKSIEPLGSLFEQATFVYLDSIVIMLMKKLKKTEKFMKKRHSKTK